MALVNLPKLEDEDLDHLAEAFVDLRFDDEERRMVLLANSTVDVHAAPGSGKTSILAAKLYLLSRKWTHTHRGICVISHTNVAREEICRRLAATGEGSRLLSYPHFIGTIHSFINRFLALPNLNSLGIVVDIIDNDVFELRANVRARRSKAAGWLKNQHNADKLVGELHYSGPDLVLSSGGGKLPGPHTDTFKALASIKDYLASDGCFRFEDMFAFAENLLKSSPCVRDRLSHRFPLLMIDEMQDTSIEQERLLGTLFNDQVVQQRFGDINQRIFSDKEGTAALTFPRHPILPMRASRRFGERIARAVMTVQVSGDPVIGDGPNSPHPPTLFLYETDSVAKVIEAFGNLVLDSFSDDVLNGKRILAVCARRDGNANQDAGRHIADYWPTFKEGVGPKVAREESAWMLLRDDPNTGVKPILVRERADKIKRVVLLALRQAQAPIAKGIRDPSRLGRAIRETEMDMTTLAKTYRQLALAKNLTSSAQRWRIVPQTLFTALQPLLSAEMGLEGFASLDVFAIPDMKDEARALNVHECIVVRNDRQLRIEVNTIGMTKGETHLSTLVLESFGMSKQFDIAGAQALLSGAQTIDAKTRDTIMNQYRYLYVGMSRPTQLLCLAMNAKRASESELVRLQANGWRVLRVP
ncbi:MAG TPA: UvrD-helicase domain-containing protein [Rhodanobacter sp.]|jgi:DNA helicase-2/ATP-dependent DNA helicase PcrA|nr:UvrD-helicase domain-containing protein [Rhodanobacter sp.]